MTTWEYATIPLLTHATKQILDQWGADGWELVQVVPGPTGSENLVAYLKPPRAELLDLVVVHLPGARPRGTGTPATCDDADLGRGARTRRGRGRAVRPHVFSVREPRS